MFLLVQFCSLVFLSVLFVSKIKWAIGRFIVCLIIGFYLSLEVLSLYLTGKFINYQFYFHFNINAIKHHGFQFYSQTALYFALVVSFCFYLNKLTGAKQNSNISKPSMSLGVIVALTILCLPSGIFGEKYEFYRLLSYEDTSFSTALRALNIDPSQYVLPEQVKAQKGKNIIVISVESLEQGFLSSRFSSLTPYLRRLTRDWTYYSKMPQSIGGEWTVAALYNQQAGMPAFFSGQGNDLFQKTKSVKITGLGHVLESAGYQRIYLMGNPDFAGSSDLLNAYRVPVVSADELLGLYPSSPAGLHDYDLFTEAKLQVERLMANTAEPFALFMSTANTHFPAGIYDVRMKNLLNDSYGEGLEYSVAAIDYLLNDFMQFLGGKGLLDNTAIYVFPDHKLMGSTGEIIRTLSQNERHLFLLTNVDQKTLKKNTYKEIYQIDLPKIIIDGAGIKTNAKFLIDFIPERKVTEFLEANKEALAGLNNASLSRVSYEKEINVFVKTNIWGENKLIISSGSDSIETEIEFNNCSEIFNVTMTDDMVPIDYGYLLSRKAFSLAKNDLEYERLHLVVELKKNQIHRVYFGNKQHVGLTKEGSYITFSAEEIALIREKNKLVNMIDVTNYAMDKNRFIAHGGGMIEGKTYTNSLEALNLNYEKGFRLFELDIIKTSDNVFVAAHDWGHWAKITGYSGILPPCRDEYVKQKIFGKYTPLEMDSINQWFYDHPDAILVTDKVNEPGEFAPLFIEKKRLMMELFSLDAVRKGVEIGIKSSMPSGDLLKLMGEDGIKLLSGLGVTDVAASYRIINTHSNLVKALLEAGLNIYAFHINIDENVDEEYILCNERFSFYGLYADEWTFSSSHEYCN